RSRSRDCSKANSRQRGPSRIAAQDLIEVLRADQIAQVAYAVAHGAAEALEVRAAFRGPDRVLFEMGQLLKGKSSAPRQLVSLTPSSVESPAAQARPERYDVFISHASEDKGDC